MLVDGRTNLFHGRRLMLGAHRDTLRRGRQLLARQGRLIGRILNIVTSTAGRFETVLSSVSGNVSHLILGVKVHFDG